MKYIFLFLTLFLFTVSPVEARKLISFEKAISKMFPKAEEVFEEIKLEPAQIEPTDIKESYLLFLSRYRMVEGGQTVAYAYEYTVRGKWGPIKFLLGVTESGEIIDTVILDYKEIRGKGVAKKRYLRQYQGKSLNDPLTIGDDIDGISGATISSKSLAEGVQMILQVHQLLQ